MPRNLTYTPEEREKAEKLLGLLVGWANWQARERADCDASLGTDDFLSGPAGNTLAGKGELTWQGKDPLAPELRGQVPYAALEALCCLPGRGAPLTKDDIKTILNDYFRKQTAPDTEQPNFLAILTDHRKLGANGKTNESPNFTLQLWSRKVAKNITELRQLWDEKYKALMPSKRQMANAKPDSSLDQTAVPILPAVMGIPNNLSRSGTVAFVGRDDTLGELHERVQAHERLAIVSIRGMGGVGKTELALQYSLHYSQTYPGGLCWLRAREAVGAQIIAFARTQLDVNPPTDLELSDQVAYCWRHWSVGEVLIIFDDVQQYSEIEPFLPPLEHRFKTLLTTRKQLGGPFSELTLDILARAESLALLQVWVNDGRIEADSDQAEWLCDWLGDLPLGLELVGRYLSQKSTVTLTTLRDRLERKRLEARALECAYPGMTATAGIAAAFEVSWEVLGSAAQRLAGLLSLFALAPIPWRLVQDCLPEVDEEDLEDWRDGLVALHLLQRLDAEGEQRYQLHQLLREFFAVKLSEAAQAGELSQRFCQVMVTVSQQIPERPTLNDIAAIEPAIPHLAETATTLKDSLSCEDLTWLFVGLGHFYEGQGLYGDAEPWYEQCLAFSRDRLGDEHPDVAESLNNLAVLYHNQGRYREAEPLFQEALVMRKRLLGDAHPLVATSLNDLAMLYHNQGRYNEAEPLLQEALTMQKRLLGDEHPRVATNLNNLAGLYINQGHYSEAEPLFQESLEMRKRLLGNTHPAVAESLKNLAVLYEHQGHYSEAEPLLQESLAMQKRLLGDAHPNVGRCSDNLAMFYSAQDKTEEAELLYTEALAILEQSLGKEHSWTIRCRDNLETLNDEQSV